MRGIYYFSSVHSMQTHHSELHTHNDLLRSLPVDKWFKKRANRQRSMDRSQWQHNCVFGSQSRVRIWNKAKITSAFRLFAKKTEKTLAGNDLIKKLGMFFCSCPNKEFLEGFHQFESGFICEYHSSQESKYWVQSQQMFNHSKLFFCQKKTTASPIAISPMVRLLVLTQRRAASSSTCGEERAWTMCWRVDA